MWLGTHHQATKLSLKVITLKKKMQKVSFNNAHSTEDLRQLILEELNKIGAWSLLSFNANNDFEETPSRTKSSCQDYEDIVKDVGHQIKKLRYKWEWNPRAKFVVLVSEIR
jgi:RNA processing factor Prp31